MYDELIRRLREWANSFCGCCKHADKKQKSCDDCTAVYGSLWEAADAIEELCKPKWIPVTERLPEDRQRVLAISLPKIRPRSSYYRLVYFSENLESVDSLEFDGQNRCGFYYYDSDYGFCEADGITHWMPLPDPAESEGE